MFEFKKFIVSFERRNSINPKHIQFDVCILMKTTARIVYDTHNTEYDHYPVKYVKN